MLKIGIGSPLLPSRRTVIAGAGTVPILRGDDGKSSDWVVTLCEAWRAKTAESHRLMRRWGDVEAGLAASHNWFKLTEHERLSLPEADELRRIDGRLDELIDERDALLAVLPDLMGATPRAVLARLAVAADLIEPIEHPKAHAIIRRVIRDIEFLSAASKGEF